MQKVSDTPYNTYAGVCGCALQVCRWSTATVSPRGVVASNRAEQFREGQNYPRLGAARLPRRRWAAKQTRDPRSASCAPFLTSFRPGLSRSVTRKCPPAGSTIVVVRNQSGGCLNMYNDVLIYPSLAHIFDIEHRKFR